MFRKLEDFLPGTGNVIRNITNEVVRECARQNVTVDVQVASLAVGLLSLDPRQGLPLSAQFDRNSLEKFVKECARKFLEIGKPSLKTLQLQVFFMQSSLDPEVIEKNNKDKIAIRLNVLLNEILNMEPTKKEDQDKLVKKIAVDIILNNNLGQPGNHQVVAETVNALKSVMSRTDLVNFIAMKKKERMENLVSIRQIVCGIRVFNKDAGHCGEGVIDILSEVAVQYKTTKQNLNDSLDEVTKQISMLSQAIRGLFDVDLNNHELRYLFPENVDSRDFEYLKEALLMSYQHEKYIKTLFKVLSQIKKDIDGKFERFKGILKLLHDIVQYRTAVTTEKVFPHFIKLCSIWKSLLETVNLMKEIVSINENMTNICELESPYEDLLEHLIHDSSRDLSGDNEADGGKLQAINDNCSIVRGNHDINALTQSNFCAYMFAIGDGLLVPANTSIGIVHYENSYYAFSKLEYGKCFIADGEKFSRLFMDTLRAHPEAVVFFDVYEEVKNFGYDDDTTEATEIQYTRVDVDVQTELHPIPYHKDKNYCWNIWDLRRKAIQLTNLKKCRTHSAQTDISYYRTDCKIQTYDLKSNNCQTTASTSTNTDL